MSPIQHKLKSISHPALGNNPLSDTETALVGAMVFLGATIGCFFWSAAANRLGRKKVSVLIILPFVVSWSLVCLSNNTICLYIARLIGGVGNAGAAINSPLYIVEISSLHLRYKLCSLPQLTACIGIVYAYTTGWLLPFHIFNLLHLVLALLALVTSLFLPESPVYYLKRNDVKKARKTLVWLRNYQDDNEQHNRLLDADLQMLESSYISQDNMTPWHDLLEPSTRNAILVGLGLISTLLFSEMTVVTVNAVSIFRHAQVNSSAWMKPHVSAIILSLMQLLGSVASVFIIRKLNRKLLLITAHYSIAFSLLMLGCFYYLKFIHFQYLQHISYMPHFALYVYIISIYIAPAPMSSVILSEMFPPDNRKLCMGIVMVYQHILTFCLVVSFPMLRANVNMFGSFWFYSVVSLISIVYIYCFVLDTSQKSPLVNVLKLNREQIKDKNEKHTVERF